MKHIPVYVTVSAKSLQIDMYDTFADPRVMISSNHPYDNCMNISKIYIGIHIHPHQSLDILMDFLQYARNPDLV